MSNKLNETFKKHLKLLHEHLNEIGDPENDTISARLDNWLDQNSSGYDSSFKVDTFLNDLDIKKGTSEFDELVDAFKERGFELLALDHVRILRIVGEQSQIECGDKLARGAIPELKDRRRQASSRHLVYKAGFAKHFQRCRVRISMPAVAQANFSLAPAACATSISRANAWRSSRPIIRPLPCRRSPRLFLIARAKRRSRPKRGLCAEARVRDL